METQNSQEIIKQIQTELSRHLSAQEKVPFKPSLKSATALSALERELEAKRQAGILSAEEIAVQRAIGDLWENIARVNTAQKGRSEKNLEPLIIPNISTQEADRIISGINEQFEEKVLKKLDQSRRAKMFAIAAPEPAAGRDSIEAAPEPGRNLQDYLSVVKAEPPEQSFADEDSNFDLTKHVRPRAEN